MLHSQMVALSAFDLSVPASARSASICARMACVCSVTVPPGALCATWPAR